MQCEIKIKLDLPDGSELGEVDRKELSLAMNAELEQFSVWFEEQGNSPLVSAEQAILRTYLAWKLRFQE